MINGNAGKSAEGKRVNGSSDRGDPSSLPQWLPVVTVFPPVESPGCGAECVLPVMIAAKLPAELVEELALGFAECEYRCAMHWPRLRATLASERTCAFVYRWGGGVPPVFDVPTELW